MQIITIRISVYHKRRHIKNQHLPKICLRNKWIGFLLLNNNFRTQCIFEGELTGEPPIKKQDQVYCTCLCRAQCHYLIRCIQVARCQMVQSKHMNGTLIVRSPVWQPWLSLCDAARTWEYHVTSLSSSVHIYKMSKPRRSCQ